MKLKDKIASAASGILAFLLLVTFLRDRPTSDFESYVAIWSMLVYVGVGAGFGWQAMRSCD